MTRVPSEEPGAQRPQTNARKYTDLRASNVRATDQCPPNDKRKEGGAAAYHNQMRSVLDTHEYTPLKASRMRDDQYEEIAAQNGCGYESKRDMTTSAHDSFVNPNGGFRASHGKIAEYIDKGRSGMQKAKLPA